MKREKKIVLLAHCLLNVNAKVWGLATAAAGCEEIVCGLLANGYGIIQLPCVEQLQFGARRWGQVKEQMDFPAFRDKCRSLLAPIIEQVADFAAGGYQLVAVIGLDGSPACGVNYTCSGDWGGELSSAANLPDQIASLRPSRQPGIMMEVLQQMLAETGIETKFLGIEESDPAHCAADLLRQLPK